MRYILISVIAYLLMLGIITSYLISLGYVKVLKLPFIPLPYGYILTHIITVSLIALCTFLTLITFKQSRQLRSIETQIGGFVGDVATYLTSGGNLYEALSLALRDVRGYFRNLMDRLITILSLGLSMDEAIDTVFRGVSKEFKYALITLAIAEKSGGRSDRVLYEASRILNDIYMFRERRRIILKQYFYLMILAIIVYDLTSIIILKILTSLSASALTIFTNADMSVVRVNIELLYTFIYYVSIMITTSAGVAYGKCVEGSAKRSATYVLVLLVINFITLYILKSIFGLTLLT